MTNRLLLTAFLLLAACSSCVLPGASLASSPGASTQDEATVLIKVLCMDPYTGDPHVHMGSGLLVPGGVLTAAHVATCRALDPLGQTIGSAPASAMVVSIGDTAAEGETVILLPELDVALMKISGKSADTLRLNAVSPRIGPRPDVGDRICATAALPERSFRCGEVQVSGETGEILTDLYVRHGNSGGPAFVNGALVGLVVTTTVCQDGHYCVGGVAPLQGLDWLVR